MQDLLFIYRKKSRIDTSVDLVVINHSDFVLEHLNFLCISLGRYEDYSWQGRKRRLSYSLSSISNAAISSHSRRKRYTKNLIALIIEVVSLFWLDLYALDLD